MNSTEPKRTYTRRKPIKRQTAMIIFVLDPDIKAKAEARAEARAASEGVSLSSLIRQLLVHELDIDEIPRARNPKK